MFVNVYAVLDEAFVILTAICEAIMVQLLIIIIVFGGTVDVIALM